MRLIHANEFIEYLGLDVENSREDNLGEIITLEDFDRQSTAYDVDKVVERLENAKTNFIGMGTLQSAYFDKGIDKAIEIVKSGGVADGE